jgi:general secretion pathway protein L
MTRKILGLDIRNDSISAVLLTSGLKGNEIESFAYVPYDEENEDKSHMSVALQKIVDQKNIGDSVCIVSFPAEEISFRNLKIPFRDQKKISQILPLELEPLLPYPIDDLLMDFQIMPLKEGSDNTDIIAVAVRKSYINECISELATFGIVPRIIAAGISHTTLCLNHFSDIPDNSIVIDIDSNKSSLFAFVSGQISLIRSMPLHSTMEKRAGALCADIQRTLAASETLTGSEIKPDAFFLTGPGLNDQSDQSDQSDQADQANLADPDYQDEIARFFDVPTYRMDLAKVSGVELDAVKASSWTPCQMDNALSLALTDITGVHWMNFSQKRFAVKKQWLEQKKNIVRSGVLAGIILFFAILNMIFDFHTAGKEIDRLDFEINKILKTSFPEITRIVDPLHQMKIKLKELKEDAAISEGAGGTILAIDILNAISNSIPASIDVEFERLVIGPDNVTISGETAAFNNVDDMKSNIEKGELFHKVVISSANTDRSENKVRFKLKMSLKKEDMSERGA